MFSLFRRAEIAPDEENAMTPLEVGARIAAQPGSRRAFLIGPMLLRSPPKLFRRHAVAPTVSFCSSGRGAPRLVVCLAGNTGRYMLPTSAFLQMIDDAQSDLLLLADPQKRYFDAGVPSFGASLVEMTARIAAFAAARGYRSLVTLGVSMGALPALRIGRMLGVPRAIGIGCRFAWHAKRIVLGEPVTAFDPLCRCVTAPMDCIAVHGRGHGKDADAALRLAALLPSLRRIELPSEKHNVLHQLFTAGTLELFMQALLDDRTVPDQPDVDRLLATRRT